MRRRARFFGIFVMLVFLAIAGRLFYLQVIEGDTFYRLTSDNIIRTDALPAVRGQVRDRKNRVLATIRPSYNLYVSPRQLTSDGFAKLRGVLGMSAEQAVEVWERIRGERSGEASGGSAAVASGAAATAAGGASGATTSSRDRERPVLLAEDISREAMAAIETGLDVSGVRIVAVPRREYPMGSLAAHVLGYMNEISAEELRAKKDEGYHAGDLVGRTGIERQWEGYLRGRDGFEKIVVDRRGLPKPNIRELIDGPTKLPAVPGNNVFLTLDADVQRFAERSLRAYSAAAAVVMEVDTGRLLAMVSKPAFDPNEMSGHLSSDAQQRILSDRYHPLRDKTLNETYFPGSTFKPVSALSALEDRLITPEDKTKCRGSFEFGRRRFKCTKTHLTVSLYEAIVQSCNVYFYEIGARPGMMDRLAKYGADMGLGAPTGLGLNGEEGGFIPTEAWYREQKKENPKAEGFQMGQSLNAVIGQGSTRVTLLQMVTLYAAIANGGKLWLPQIVERIESPDQKVLEEFAPRVRRELSVSPDNLALIRQGLVGVVNEPKGTAFRSRTKDIEVAGKTGTAQVRRNPRHGEAISAYDQNDHAWFVGFAPAGNPKIAFAVLIEHGGHGGEVAAPAAMEIVHNYFETVAPEQRNAPRVGLPRHKLFHLNDDERAAAEAGGGRGGVAHGRRARLAAQEGAGDGDGAGAGEGKARRSAPSAPVVGGAGAASGDGERAAGSTPVPGAP